MAPAKTEDYTEDDVRIARFAKALGHPARIAILRYLASLDTCCFHDISNELPIAASTVSQHLSELKEAGLIQGTFEPPRVKYCINLENWNLTREFFNKFFSMRIIKAQSKLAADK